IQAADEFPFAFREGLIWVQVRADESKEPLNFILDTGASVSVLNLSTVKRLGLPLGGQVSVNGVRTDTLGYWPQQLSATASGVTLPQDYLAIDLSGLARACGASVDGLIGADFF